MLLLVLHARDRSAAGWGCRGGYHWVISLNQGYFWLELVSSIFYSTVDYHTPEVSSDDPMQTRPTRHISHSPDASEY